MTIEILRSRGIDLRGATSEARSEIQKLLLEAGEALAGAGSANQKDYIVWNEYWRSTSLGPMPRLVHGHDAINFLRTFRNNRMTVGQPSANRSVPKTLGELKDFGINFTGHTDTQIAILCAKLRQSGQEVGEIGVTPGNPRALYYDNTIWAGSLFLRPNTKHVGVLKAVEILDQLRAESGAGLIERLRGFVIHIRNSEDYTSVEALFKELGERVVCNPTQNIYIRYSSDNGYWVYTTNPQSTSRPKILSRQQLKILSVQQLKLLITGDPMATETPNMLVWKNPKPKQRNQRALRRGAKVVVDGMTVPQIIKSTEGDPTSVALTEEGMRVNNDEVFPLYERRDNQDVTVGDIIDLAAYTAPLLVVKMDETPGFVLTNRGRVAKDAIQQCYSTKPEKQLYQSYSCGTLSYNDVNYKTLKELKEANVGFTFKAEKIDQPFDLKEIAEHYNMNIEEIVAKDVTISKNLDVSLDHPVNVAANEWALMVGQSGTGKTTEAIEYAHRKKKDYITVQGTAELTIDDIIGYKSVTTGEYFRSSLREAVEFGKIYILDEIDACRPNAVLAFNSLKQGEFEFPDAKIQVHKDFRFIATANTLEYSEEFNARSPMDKASLKRFDVIEYNLEEWELAVRYGLKYVKQIKNISRKDPREIEREINKIKITEGM